MTTTATADTTTTATAGGDVATLTRRLHHTIDAIITAVTSTTDENTMAVIADLLNGADRAKAAAVEASLGMTHAGVLAEEGLTAGSYLRVHARRTAAEERSLGYLVERLADLPTLRGWYRDGIVSDGVVREIAWATRNLTKAQRRWIDQTLAGDPARVIRLGGDGLVDAVQRLADHARPELERARQQRAFDGRRVHAQERLDGTGGTLFADLDAEGFHTVLTALDTYQPNTHNTHTDTDKGDDTANGDNSDSHHDRDPRRGDGDRDGARDSSSGGDSAGGDGGEDGEDGEDGGEYGARDRWRTARSRRRADALAAIARHRNADTCPANHPTHDCTPTSHGAAAGNTDTDNGGGGVAHGGVAGAVGWAPPPAAASLLILADIAALVDPQHRDHATATLLAKTAGGPVRVTATAADRLLCDGTWRLIFTDGAEIIAVAPTQQKVPVDLKAMVTARDLHCRFPSCQTPAPACDIHHLTPRHHGGATTLENLAAICPQHHHAIHDGGWTATRHPDDTLTFTRRRTTITTLPAVQRPFTPTTPPPAGRPPRRRARGPAPPLTHITPASGRPTRPPPPADDERQPEPLPF